MKESIHVGVTFDHTSKFLYDVLIDIRVDLCFATIILSGLCSLGLAATLSVYLFIFFFSLVVLIDF